MRSTAAGYRKRREELEPLVRLLADLLAVVAVIRQARRESQTAAHIEEEET